MKKVTIRDINWRCFLFGHKISKHTDSGYHYCNRCPSHEYYDYEIVDAFGGLNRSLFTLPSFWQYITWHLGRLKDRIFTRCWDCKRITSLFGKRIGKFHDDCLPF